MNLANGKIISSEQSSALVDQLPDLIYRTLNNGSLTLDEVINACDTLSKTFVYEKYADILKELGISLSLIDVYLKDAKQMLSKDYLFHKVKTELGNQLFTAKTYIPPFNKSSVTEQRVPLGILLHIAAGNMDGLPVFTIIEGLLSLNINIVKLPSEERGLSIMILQELIAIEPKLAPYIYVFDFSSKDTENLTKLAAIADAVVVWGGDNVIKAVRKMTTPSTKIIEWGHKVSFAYIDPINLDKQKLILLAQNICKTNQLLCSSCQGIYLDTNDDNELLIFAEYFIKILDEVANKYELDYSTTALIGLTLYNNTLKSMKNKHKIIRGKNSSITIIPDSNLETSIMYRNLWLKKLPKEEIVKTLKPHKGYLQTVALIANNNENYTNLLLKAGLERIIKNGNMTSTYCGEPHDGSYPLIKYTKIIFKSDD